SGGRPVPGDGRRRVPPSPRSFARGHARGHVRRRVPAAEHCSALVRPARQDRRIALVAEPAVDYRRSRHPEDLDRLGRRRGGLPGVVLGGMNRLVSATLGGFAIGFASGFLGGALPTNQSQYLPSFLFAAVIVVLLIRPRGLFARGGQQAVERV